MPLKNFPGTIVLISHDEHLGHAVANRVIDVRDGKITVYDGDYDYYLFKRDELAQGNSVNSTMPDKLPRGNASAQTPQMDKPKHEGGKKTKEQRRAEAEARSALNKRLKKTKSRLSKVKKGLEENRGSYDELMGIMASEELYADQDKFSAALAEYNVLKKEIPTLEDEWLELSTEIEEETARANA